MPNEVKLIITRCYDCPYLEYMLQNPVYCTYYGKNHGQKKFIGTVDGNGFLALWRKEIVPKCPIQDGLWHRVEPKEED